ncbi:unnamed protein product [Arabis nemorensis]|uniref:Uncharacterized protein n=1 Tax=Arabis nemorensis TaxID=586526 RepID=A0A565AZ00_9BRAS|nr:unnamed protein product [Arabis nemorensis]
MLLVLPPHQSVPPDPSDIHPLTPLFILNHRRSSSFAPSMRAYCASFNRPSFSNEALPLYEEVTLPLYHDPLRHIDAVTQKLLHQTLAVATPKIGDPGSWFQIFAFLRCSTTEVLQCM